jgi:hypothetical protein
MDDEQEAENRHRIRACGPDRNGVVSAMGDVVRSD